MTRKEGFDQTNRCSVPLSVILFDIQPMSLVFCCRRRYPEGRTELACSFSPFTLHYLPPRPLFHSLFSLQLIAGKRAASALLSDHFPSSFSAITHCCLPSVLFFIPSSIFSPFAHCPYLPPNPSFHPWYNNRRINKVTYFWRER